MANQSGKVSNPSAPPFATSAGKPTVNDEAKGNDFVQNPTGNGDKSGGSHVPESRKQEQPGGTAPNTANAPWLRSRTQTPGTAAQRVNPQSIPPGGISMVADPGKAARAIGAQPVGATPKPFKNMR